MSNNWTREQAEAYIRKRLSHEQRARETIQREGLPKAKFYETDSNLGGVSNTECKHSPVETLERKAPRSKQGASGLGTSRPLIRVQIISLRAKLTDSDNLAAKWLRDAISASLGIDDGDSRIEWEVSQVLTGGEQGVIVRVENL